MNETPRVKLEKDLTRSAEGITRDMLVRTPEANIALITTVAQNYAKRLIEINKEEEKENAASTK